MSTKKDPRISLQSMRVLSAIMEKHPTPVSGSEIAALTALASGTLYPILMRFEQAGWLRSKWENVEPSEVGRPRKRIYTFSASGVRKAREVLTPFARAKLA